MKMNQISLSFNELCQKLDYIMHSNFNGLKRNIIFEPEKLICSGNCRHSASKQPKRSREVSNKTHRLLHSYEIIHTDLKALGFSK